MGFLKSRQAIFSRYNFNVLANTTYNYNASDSSYDDIEDCHLAFHWLDLSVSTPFKALMHYIRGYSYLAYPEIMPNHEPDKDDPTTWLVIARQIVAKFGPIGVKCFCAAQNRLVDAIAKKYGYHAVMIGIRIPSKHVQPIFNYLREIVPKLPLLGYEQYPEICAAFSAMLLNTGNVDKIKWAPENFENLKQFSEHWDEFIEEGKKIMEVQEDPHESQD